MIFFCLQLHFSESSNTQELPAARVESLHGWGPGVSPTCIPISYHRDNVVLLQCCDSALIPYLMPKMLDSSIFGPYYRARSELTLQLCCQRWSYEENHGLQIPSLSGSSVQACPLTVTRCLSRRGKWSCNMHVDLFLTCTCFKWNVDWSGQAE